MGLSPWDTQEDDASLEVKVRLFHCGYCKYTGTRKL
jgi:hypothetical protein